MNKTSLVAIAILGALTAFGDMKQERKSSAYQAAMQEYSAGRLDAAIAGFEKVLKTEGDSASARFQLACLLQDYRHDWIGAICHYREYLRLEPKSDKSPLANDRVAICEKELAKELAAKYGFGALESVGDSAQIQQQIEFANNELKAARTELEKATANINRLELENIRLRRILMRMDFDDSGKATDYEESGSISVNDLLDGDDDEQLLNPISVTSGAKVEDDGANRASALARPDLPNDIDSADKGDFRVASGARTLEDASGPNARKSNSAYLEDDISPAGKIQGPSMPADADSTERGDTKIDSRAKFGEDAGGPKAVKSSSAYENDEGDSSALKAGLAAAKEIVEEDESGPVLLVENRAPAATKLTDFAQNITEKPAQKEDLSPASRPKTYVVQEGDTLSSIALKFYGRKNEWKAIREANKATISTDNRIRTGRTIVLP